MQGWDGSLHQLASLCRVNNGKILGVMLGVNVSSTEYLTRSVNQVIESVLTGKGKKGYWSACSKNIITNLIPTSTMGGEGLQMFIKIV